METPTEFKCLLWGQGITVYTGPKGLMQQWSRVHLGSSLLLKITLGGIWSHHCVHIRDPQHICRCHVKFGLHYCHQWQGDMDDFYPMLVSLHCQQACWRYITDRLQDIHEPCVFPLQWKKQCIPSLYGRLQNSRQQISQWDNTRIGQVIWSSWSLISQSYAKMARIYKTEHLCGIIITSSTQVWLVSKKHFTVQCIGKVRDIQSHVKKCCSYQLNKQCMKSYGQPWEELCVDLVGPYNLQEKDST